MRPFAFSERRICGVVMPCHRLPAPRTLGRPFSAGRHPICIAENRFSPRNRTPGQVVTLADSCSTIWAKACVSIGKPSTIQAFIMPITPLTQ